GISRLPDTSILPNKKPQRRPSLPLPRVLLRRVRLVARFGRRSRFLDGVVRWLSEEPLPNMLRDGQQPAVLHTLPVVPANRGVAVAHNQVAGHGVTGHVGDGAEDVPERIEADPLAMDADGLHQVARRDTDRVGDSPTEPGPTARRHEDHAARFL